MQIIEDRRALHRIPELDMDLPQTMAYLRSRLETLNCTLFSPIESSLCARFDFGQEKTIAFRADADALPIAEATGLPFASQYPGRMHACGHDGHMAILLELARRLDRKKSNPCNVLLIFQPAEETTGGAGRLCRTGLLEKQGVEAIFGLHLWPGLEAGKVASRVGPMMIRSCEVNVDVFGKAAHIAKAGEAVDATAAGLELYRRVDQMERAIPKDVFRLLKFGRIESGTVRNIISGHMRLEGSLRAFEDDVFEGLQAGIREIAGQMEAEFGCRVEVSMSEGYPAVRNPKALFDRIRSVVEFDEVKEPALTAEDFSWYQQYVPGLFFFLGLGDVPPLHAPEFQFDETILEKGADFFEKIGEKY